ncbi:beta-ketoacyl reductase, partial [Bradyrhizobium sp. OK095]|uniref:beta-ketoacyl reductase n=1 Tax=Bradyrhizobium sp. OK095 TaxID=1882760 RepID=UPI0008CC2CB1
ESGIEELYQGEVRREKDTLAVFADEDMAQIAGTWIGQGRYTKLLELWVKGASFDWEGLYGETRPRRIPLPTYPFAKERYWIETAQVQAQVQAPATAASVAEGIAVPEAADEAADPFELLTFEEVWEEQALAGGPVRLPRKLVCLLSDAGNQRCFAGQIRELAPQAEVIFVAQHEVSRLHRDAGDGDSYRQVMSRVRAEHGAVDAVLYLWGLEDSTCLPDAVTVKHVLQALASSGLECERLLLAGACGEGLDRCHLESWIGFERSLGLVWPQTRVAVIGLEQDVAVEERLQRLIAELTAEQIASAFYRRGRREVCRVRPRALEDGESVLRTGGTYAISGGCGGLGLLLARHLARTRQAKLILIGRSGLDAAKRDAVAELEALGSAVMYLQADVCDRGAIEQGLRSAELRFGALHGVIHAAGLNDGRSVFEKDDGHFAEVLAPKVTGTLVLDEVLGDRSLDFVCYFSSAAAMLGDFGACDYAVGNRFLMAHGRYRNQLQSRRERSGRTIVVNWGLWQDGGMGMVDAASTRMYLKSSGQRALGSQEGVELFERLLGQACTQHLVLVGDRQRVHRFLGLERTAAETEMGWSDAGRAYRGERAELTGLSVAQCVSWDLKEHVSGLLKVARERLDDEENLADFGFDSISLAELGRRLARHYGIEVPPSVFFSHPTLAQLTDYLVAQHAAAV